MQQRDTMRARCDQMGLHWARSVLPGFFNNENFPYIAEWISEREGAIANELEAKQLMLAERSVGAAENHDCCRRISTHVRAVFSRGDLLGIHIASCAARRGCCVHEGMTGGAPHHTVSTSRGAVDVSVWPPPLAAGFPVRS